MSESDNRYILNDLFLACMCKRFLDIPGTKILVLVGKELFSRIKRRIDDIDIPLICSFLNKNTNVLAANLAFNHVTDKGLTIIADFLGKNISLIELNLMNNDISSDGMITLTNIKNNLTLRSLRLNGNKIGAKGLKCLATMITGNQLLSNLDVGETDLNLEAFLYFMNILKNNETNIQSINLNRVLGPPGHVLQTDQIAHQVEVMLTLNRTLKELHLQKIGFMDHDIERLTEGLKNNSTIQLLDLSCNSFGDFGVEFLSQYLGNKPSLLTLLISSNNIKDAGARSLSFKLPYSKLEYLDISKNKITDDGILDILNTLKKEHPLKGLYIRGNAIGEKSSKVIYRMILSEVLFDNTLDVEVYLLKEKFVVKSNPFEDHLKPHYYCLCSTSEQRYCRQCNIMMIRNK